MLKSYYHYGSMYQDDNVLRDSYCKRRHHKTRFGALEALNEEIIGFNSTPCHIQLVPLQIRF